MPDPLTTDIVDLLIKARETRYQWDVCSTAPPNSVDEAYAIQEIVTQRLEAGIFAWKTSAPDPESVPIAAPIYSNLVYKSGSEIPASELFVIGIEGEIAFRIAKDLPLLEAPYSREDLLESIGDLLPVIEIVDTRMQDGFSQHKNLMLADNQSNGGLVVGDGVSNWKSLDFANLQASVSVNGVVEYSGVDGNRAGDLFRLMAWAANHCAYRARPFKAGDIITTGTYTGILFVEPGAEVVVDFPGIGAVEVSFPI
jgi:2-keto-4-pentenoate hydratase